MKAIIAVITFMALVFWSLGELGTGSKYDHVMAFFVNFVFWGWVIAGTIIAIGLFSKPESSISESESDPLAQEMSDE